MPMFSANFLISTFVVYVSKVAQEAHPEEKVKNSDHGGDTLRNK